MTKVLFLFLGIVLLSATCRKKLELTNSPSTEDAHKSLLSTALAGTASNSAASYLVLTRWMGYWARTSGFPPDVPAETYALTNNYTDREWKNLYQNIIIYDSLEKVGISRGMPFYVGVAKVMKAYVFSTLVDLYNDVPYKSAFTNQPVYDKGQDIYNDLVKQLDGAFEYFEKARTYYEQNGEGVANKDDKEDVMFGSARSKVTGYDARLSRWEKFTNTLQLKLLVHQSQVAAQQSFIKAKVNELTNSPRRKTAGFIGAGEGASINPGYQMAPGKLNPFYALFRNADESFTDLYRYYSANAYGSNFYKEGNDPRRSYFYFSDTLLISGPCEKCGDTAYIVYLNDTLFLYNFTFGPVIAIYHSDTIQRKDFGPTYDGDPKGRPAILSERIGFHTAPNSDMLILSDFESLFLQAEAVQRGYLTGQAQAFYEAAIAQNFVYLIGDDNGASSKDYYLQNKRNIGWSASPNKLEAILTQKWAAMNGVNWVEAYSDYRRTGYPGPNILGISHAPSHVQPKIPIRFLYPQLELDKNAAHVPRLGANAQFTSNVFWDQ